MWPGLVRMISSRVSFLDTSVGTSLDTSLAHVRRVQNLRPRVRLFRGRRNLYVGHAAPRHGGIAAIVFIPALWLHGALFWDQKHAKQVPRRDAEPDHAAQG